MEQALWHVHVGVELSQQRRPEGQSSGPSHSASALPCVQVAPVGKQTLPLNSGMQQYCPGEHTSALLMHMR